MSMFEPCYLQTYQSGKLQEITNTMIQSLSDCNGCPQHCGTDRTINSDGICKTGRLARIASYNPHFGEESPLVGLHGSGTIFFSNCNLNCHFCQNFEISQHGVGQEVTPQRLSNMMLDLQDQGCQNINLVTPSHVVPQILEALILAIPDGLNLPLVYNSSAYDSIQTLKNLEGIIDIYMPDFKFWDSNYFAEICSADNYREIACDVIKEMHRQVGDLQLANDNIARRGLLVRHMVMPGRLSDTESIVKFLAKEISTNTYINLMAQYRPTPGVAQNSELSRPIEKSEFRQALRFARDAGIQRLDWESKRVVFDWQ